MALPTNMRVNTQFPFPALVTGSGGISVSKKNGIWNIAPNFSALAQIVSLPNPSVKEVWVFDPVTGVYNVMTLAALTTSMFTDISSTSQAIGTGSLTFTVNPGKAWTVGSWVLFSSAANNNNFLIGQVTAYGTAGGLTALTVNVTNVGGSGTHADWNISLTGAPGLALGLSSIEYIFDGGGQPLIVGMEGYLQIPFGCTILASNLFADQSGSIQLDVRKVTFAGYPASGANSIVSADPPALAAAQKVTDSALTGWTTIVNPNDILVWHVTSTSGAITRVTHNMPVQRTT